MATGHLPYYEQHAISPVRYRIETLSTHFERRDSLCRSLGLPPLAIKGSRVLEIAPGSGQNSLYVACCHPASYDLVEPNEAGRRDINASFAALEQPHTAPQIHPHRFELFTADQPFDLVWCENWLGSLPHERALIRKLATLLAPGGVLVLTIVPLTGFFPNIMRKLLALRMINPVDNFAGQTAQMVDVFSPHLKTIASMTRSHQHWVQDCVLNPHYLNVALPLDTVLEEIGQELEILSTFPRFTVDWRWFKALSGPDRRFNSEALAAYRRNAHNFIDYRAVLPPREEADNDGLEAACRAIHQTAVAWQTRFTSGERDVSDLTDKITDCLGALETELAKLDHGLAAATAEVRKIWARPAIDPNAVRTMEIFNGLFGRETVHVSFTRPQ